MTSQALDQAKTEAFGGKMVTLLNDSFLGIMCSIGHQTGLFDTLSTLPPSTSREIAAAARLNERYVREWLGAVVTGGIVEYDPQKGTYQLPPEHARFLTRAAGPDNMAFFTRYIALCGLVEPKVAESFRNGGGVPYSAYPEFQALQAEESSALYDAALIDTILPLAPGIVDRLRSGIDVADIGTGQGHAVNLMAKAFPKSRLVGYDFSEEGIAAGTEEAKRWGLSNARFEARDVAALDATDRYDFITAFDTVHDQAKPGAVLGNICRALRPGGTLLMMDIAASSKLEENLEHPIGPLLYGVSVLHCMTVSLSQGGDGLGTVWGEQLALRYLADAGFREVEVKHLPGDIMHAFYVTQRP